MTILMLAACAFGGVFVPARDIPAPAAEIPISAPEGWKSSQQDGATVLTPGDLPEGKIYTVIVTPLQTKAGTLDEVYEIGKKEMGEVGTYTPISTSETQQSGGGWDYKFSIGTLDKDGKALISQVTAVKKGDVGGVIIVLSDGIETMKTYSAPMSEMLRSIGGAPKPPPAPAIAPASGSVDLQYTVPSGWVETKKQGATLIESSHEDFYNKWRWSLVIMPSQPLTGSLADNFKEYWGALVSANYNSAIVPLPLLARLESGNACAFDSEERAVHKISGAKPRIVSVYLVAQGNRFVPILAILYGYQDKLDADVDRFLQTATIPGASSGRIPLFTKSDLVGDWKEGSAEIASYVTSAGDYAGDASIYTGGFFTFLGDGSYDHTLIALSGNTRLKEKDNGTWRVEGDELVCAHQGGSSRYSLLGYGVDPKAGRFLVMGSHANSKIKISLANPRGLIQASWYKAK